jgi:putative endonuclease
MATTYILYSQKTNKFYTGSSRTGATSRLIAHNAGHTKSTKSGRPWMIVFEEQYATYTEARQRENFLKSGAGRKWIGENFGSLKSQSK